MPVEVCPLAIPLSSLSSLEFFSLKVFFFASKKRAASHASHRHLSHVVSAINGGLKKLDFFKRELVQSYGLEALLAVSNLEKAGLLRKDAKAWWPPMKKVRLRRAMWLLRVTWPC